MAKQKAKTYSEEDRLKAGFYKGYEINWLRKERSHPDYHLVAEFDKKHGKKGK